MVVENFVRSIIFLTWIIGLPAIGILFLGESLLPFFTFPPIPREPGEASLSWLVFGLLATLITTTLAPFLWRFISFPAIVKPKGENQTFPWWGWLALLWVASSWILAWTRFPWFYNLQPHTFPLLWFGYIVALNALTLQRSGQCLLTSRPRTLGKLFFLSAGFWWLFEYLNQYVRNWHYANLQDISYIEFIFYTSLSFSTVLPAVLSTYEWLETFPRLTTPFAKWHQLPWVLIQPTSWMLLGFGCLGLVFHRNMANHSFPPALALSVSSFIWNWKKSDSLAQDRARRLASPYSFFFSCVVLRIMVGIMECLQPGSLGIHSSLCPSLQSL